MKGLLRRLLARLSSPPFGGRWTSQVIESTPELETLADADPRA